MMEILPRPAGRILRLVVRFCDKKFMVSIDLLMNMLNNLGTGHLEFNMGIFNIVNERFY